MFRLDDRVALVTGASRGLGRAIAVVLARAGATVVGVARDDRKLNEVASEIRAAGGEAHVYPTDLAVPDACRAVIADAAASLGRLDILVNNAGLGAGGSVLELTEDTWDAVIQVNLKALFLLSQAAAPHMRDNGWGRIINIASISGQTGGIGGAAAYSASKGGVLAMTKTLARDLAPFGITVNAIAPGQIETDMGRVPPERMAEICRLIPLGRVGVPDDIAYAALYLASEEAGYVTGATLDVNGGILKR
jgi:NAD(P)-dependent dehydrogenase (short-subunit alcohol dehydrogenase family)